MRSLLYIIGFLIGVAIALGLSTAGTYYFWNYLIVNMTDVVVISWKVSILMNLVVTLMAYLTKALLFSIVKP